LTVLFHGKEYELEEGDTIDHMTLIGFSHGNARFIDP
jgi:hypothetical protein